MKLANATTNLCFDRNDVLAPIHMDDAKRIELALEFTRVYRQHVDKPVALREALCQQAVLPKMCRDIPDAYHDFVHTGNARLIVDVLKHNVLDLITMADIMSRFPPA